MKNKLRSFLLLTIVFLFGIILTSCDGKTPEKGYVSENYILENVINNIDSTKVAKTYSFEGNFNYLGVESEKLPETVKKENITFVDSQSCYDEAHSSYYLDLPLHITKENWIVYTDNAYDINLSTKYALESRIYQPNGGYLDTIYYYKRTDGGFYLKAFGVNKRIKIGTAHSKTAADKPTVIEPNGKWNIICEYDANGYLISETFETINAHKDSDTKTIYGKAVYIYTF